MFAVGICFVKVILVVIDCIASVRSWFATRAHIARHIKLLYDLPDQEHAIMAYLLKRNTQSFPYPYGEGRLVGLLSKGLISRPGGQHQQLSWPHYIPDHVWAEMKANTDKFVLVPPNANPL
nr:super-infection exclusion protein B [Phyllobacterium sp. 21LDTY02-6]